MNAPPPPGRFSLSRGLLYKNCECIISTLPVTSNSAIPVPVLLVIISPLIVTFVHSERYKATLNTDAPPLVVLTDVLFIICPPPKNVKLANVRLSVLKKLRPVPKSHSTVVASYPAPVIAMPFTL